MRPAQQNRRMRGRGNNNNNNNNRKGPNPLSRNYESNGPDVKIRGNAQHIAEKYTTLARDAQASGDRVMAENYLQHAEHYNRIIMAAMAQNNIPFQREETFDNDGADEDEAGFSPAASSPQPASGTGPQPVIEGTPAEVIYGEENSEGRSQQREGREQRRPVRGRRPQRERFNAEEGSEQPSVETPAAAAQADSAPVAQAPVPAPAPESVPAAPVEEAEPVAAAKEPAPAAKKAAPKKAAAATVENGEEEEGAVRRTRRPGRPRRVTKESEASETPAAETVASEA
ncbi:DUF4167 domain-containing protein [Falsochrobactrum shanghaiense]|uniref:DUF4167 domain-containing protein n=1 Tax=Falsochrobactrum shanghaiense TaxID=2201899 RepID=A0A316JX36_9HYPH|nr:DUF4167 domain-containing protein [Falsochrobactrum shanghaiense]PWL19700.1 DUF4167 domain-containing protein [Falsochrobactrum shanghaiense]